jgi:hypothetical protein
MAPIYLCSWAAKDFITGCCKNVAPVRDSVEKIEYIAIKLANEDIKSVNSNKSSTCIFETKFIELSNYLRYKQNNSS